MTNKKPRTGVIIAAAGTGSRMGTGKLKQLRFIDGKPVLTHSIMAFDNHNEIDEIIITVPPNSDPDEIKSIAIDLYGFDKIKAVVPGGEHRQASVWKGLMALSEEIELVLIHDAARPFITPERITDCLRAVERYGAASLGVKSKDTVKIANDNGEVLNTLSRDTIWLVQTPQGFSYDLLIQAHKQAQRDDFIGTDDASLVERLGVKEQKVQMVEGDYGNIKLTTPEDFAVK